MGPCMALYESAQARGTEFALTPHTSHLSGKLQIHAGRTFSSCAPCSESGPHPLTWINTVELVSLLLIRLAYRLFSTGENFKNTDHVTYLLKTLAPRFTQNKSPSPWDGQKDKCLPVPLSMFLLAHSVRWSPCSSWTLQKYFCLGAFALTVLSAWIFFLPASTWLILSPPPRLYSAVTISVRLTV